MIRFANVSLLLFLPLLLLPSCSAVEQEGERIEILGSWAVEEGSALGLADVSKEGWGTSLLFERHDRVVWTFTTPDGMKSYFGTYHIDPSADPKQIDLSEPGVRHSPVVARGIYKIEGGVLTICMGKHRPSHFSKSEMAYLTLKPTS